MPASFTKRRVEFMNNLQKYKTVQFIAFIFSHQPYALNSADMLFICFSPSFHILRNQVFLNKCVQSIILLWLENINCTVYQYCLSECKCFSINSSGRANERWDWHSRRKKLNHYDEQINLSSTPQKTQALNLRHLTKWHAN